MNMDSVKLGHAGAVDGPDLAGVPSQPPARSLHPAVLQVLQYFKYGHLPEKLQRVSRPFCDLAWTMAEWAPDSPEMTVALRKLLECKDACVRACL